MENFGYELEELVPIVAELSEKYTSRQSSSITYEKAEQLMGAVLYCIRETVYGKENELVSQRKLSAKEAYQRGYELVLQKTKDALALYHSILPDFDAYGNRCLSDTVLRGMPEFFKWYDARFCPQDTILTLDYPIPLDLSGYQGIDAIWQYQQYIQREQEYLRGWSKAEIMERLEAYHPGYQELIENLIEMVSRSSRPLDS